MKFDIKSLKLAEAGARKITWAGNEMTALSQIRTEFKTKKPLKGMKIGACLHVTAETGNLMIALKEAGAKVALCASNPLSTQDDVAASLVSKYKIPVFAKKGENKKTYYQHLHNVLESKPNYLMDDGADLIGLVHSSMEKFAKNIIGGAEETTTGVIRLKALAQAGKVKFPILAVNDSKVKFLFDNRYGTGQSTIDGIMRATNILLAGRRFVVCGYGWVGKGIAKRASGMGASVIVTEVDPIRALEAKMDGFDVMSMEKAAAFGEIFITATGDKNVIDTAHFKLMKNGVILANAGHFNVEINVTGLEQLAKKKEQIRPNLTAFEISKGKTIFLIAEGRLINLAVAEGHPAAVMDLSFSAQAKAVEYIWKNRKKLKRQIYSLPKEIELQIAEMKLQSMGITIDKLTEEQKKYMSSWEAGT